MKINLEKVMKEVLVLDSDPYNYAVVCWNNFEGYKELKKNAKNYCKKYKLNNKSKEEKQARFANKDLK